MEANVQTLPVATHLPAGYLAIQPLGLGKGVKNRRLFYHCCLPNTKKIILPFFNRQNAGPDITWIDGQRQIFSVSFQLISTVFTRDPHLHNFFVHAERILDTKPSAVPSDLETCKILKAAHAIQLVTAITFLPTILNQLFALLTCNTSEEVGLYIIRVLIHIINLVHQAGRKEILQAYVKVREPL